MEEDIEHLKDLKVELENMSITGPTSEDRLNTHRKSLAIENILNELKRLQRENKELKVNNDKTIKEGREAILYYTKDSIPKQVIRDEIEKLEKDAEKIREKKKDASDSDRSKSRLQAYLTKTNEIVKRLKKITGE